MTMSAAAGSIVILVDESVGRPIIERLRSEGYQVQAIEEVAPSVDDDVVLDMAARENALLLTEDKDFGDFVYQRHLPVGEGIVLLRLEGMSTDAKCDRVAEVFAQRLTEMRRSFTVITQRSVRIRTEPLDHNLAAKGASHGDERLPLHYPLVRARHGP